MTKKDYVVIAEALAHATIEAERSKKDVAVWGADIFITTMAKFLQADNVRFDPVKFRNYVTKRYEDMIVLLHGLI